MSDIIDFLREVSRLETADGLWQKAIDCAREIGFVHLSYYRHDDLKLPSRAPSREFGEASDINSGDGMRLGKDRRREGLARSWTSSKPFRWSHKTARELWGDERVEHIARFAKVSDGNIAIPVFGPMTQNGFFFAVYEKEKKPRPIEQRLLQVKLQYIHTSLCDMEIGAAQRTRLSAKEKQVLVLVSEGKRTADIAAEMNISPYTVDTYLRRAYDKLNVNDRVSAAVVAFRGGCLI